MKPAKKIQDSSKLYTWLRHYVDWSLIHAYREHEIVGLENIPENTSIILAPNHSNALMDALIVLSMNEPYKVFVARADMFRVRILAKILTFLKIMPIMRIRDGVDEVKKNQETIDKSVSVLEDGVPFCILPEGTHRPQHSLLPLGKGIFRIGLQAQELLGDKRDVCIVPVGIEYGNYYRYRSTVFIQVGEPINLREQQKAHPELQPAELTNLLRQKLTKAMQQLILYLPANERYDASHELVTLVSETTQDEMRNEGFVGSKLHCRVKASQRIAKNITSWSESQPQKMEELLQLCQEIHDSRMQHKISCATTSARRPWCKHLPNYLLSLICAPYLLVCLLAQAPIAGIGKILLGLFKDRAFHNSIRLVLNLIFWPLMMLIYGILLFCNLPWEWALVAFTALTPFPIFAQDAFRTLRLLVSDWKLTCNKGLRQAICKARELYQQLNTETR
ncbi:MAG: 1-acyl-sn-glycerol-3-phosphate acyltransferase [Bacteroidales bacterium]|nr:1-acyl-sn-glycerol-3-phosphate acyltransferase [Bacteroidales bacterium]